METVNESILSSRVAGCKETVFEIKFFQNGRHSASSLTGNSPSCNLSRCKYFQLDRDLTCSDDSSNSSSIEA